MSTTSTQMKVFGSLRIKNESTGEFEAILATLNVVDRDGDVILPSAVESGSVVAISAYGHAIVGTMFGGGGQLPAGKGRVFVEGDKLIVRGRLFLETELGRNVLAVLKEMGSSQQWSFGFETLDSEPPSDEWKKRGALRILTRIDVFEASPVIRGASIGSRTVSAKCDGCGARHGAGACSCSTDTAAIVAKVKADMKARDKLLAPLPLSDAEVKKLNEGIAAVMLKYGMRPTEARIDVERHHTALAVVAWGAAKCGIIPPAVKWFASDTPLATSADGLYFFGDHTIWLRTDLHGWKLAEVALHELAHSARHARALPNTEECVEADTQDLLATYVHEVRYGW